VPNFSTNNAGNYTVVVTNAYGSLTSSVAGLTLMAPPFIISGPSNPTALPGATVSFSVTVGDTTGPFIYQWQFNGANLPTNIITTVAGNGSTTFSGDGGPAINASLYSPMGTAVDASGNVYIADQGHNVIRKVDLNGMITTVAGGGTSSLGDGGQATNASLNYPIGVALDTNGNLYIVDDHNNRIRKVATNGVITTVAGNGAANYTGDGGQATNATLNNPSAVAFDALGNLYITDNDNDAIRKVNTAGIITTVADGFDHLHGIAVDAFGNLYVSDYYLDAILEVAANGMITTLAGISEVLAGPDGLSMDAYGSLYIADYGYNRIWKVATNGNITTVAGSGAEGFSGDGGAAASASLYNPWGVSLDVAGNVYIADYSNQRIRKVLAYGGYPTLTLLNVVATNAGNYTVVITTPYGSVTSAVVSLTVEAPPVITVQPASQFVAEGSSATFSLAAAGSGPFGYLLYFGGTNLVQSGTNSALTLPAVSTNNTGNYTLVVTNAYGSATSQVASLTVGFAPSVTSQTGEQTVLLGSNVTLSVAVGGTGPFTYQWQINGTNLPNNLITTVAGTNGSGYSGDGGQATKATLDYPYGVAVDAFGNVYIADTYNQRIRKVAANGTITTVAGTNGSGYTGDGGAATKATLYYPYGVAVDSFGNLYIADTDNSRIRKVATNGIITTVAGTNGYGYSGDGGPATNARLYYPYGVAVDLSGNLYIADTDNSRIRKVATNGIITTVAGTNGSGYSGDGGAAINSMLNDPRGVAVDSSGNLYIADIYNSRIRKVATNGIITTVAGTNGSGYSGDGGPAANARLYYPYGVAMDSSGNLYIADSENSRIRKVSTNGIITTVAGTNSSGFSGDGGPAANASLDYPGGVAVDSSGNLYIADTDNQRIREVQLAGFPTLVLTNVSTNNAGNYTVLVTGPFGSVTSAVATVNVALSAPQILTGNASFGFLANQFGFNLSGPSGLAIVVDGSTDLVTWTPLLTNTSGSGSPLYFYDPYWTNFPWRFYRARLP
jgi:sugar lactone lactonase YvrE